MDHHFKLIAGGVGWSWVDVCRRDAALPFWLVDRLFDTEEDTALLSIFGGKKNAHVSFCFVVVVIFGGELGEVSWGR